MPIGVNTNFSSILKNNKATICYQGRIGMAPSTEMRVPKTKKMRVPKIPCMMNLGDAKFRRSDIDQVGHPSISFQVNNKATTGILDKSKLGS